MAKVVDTVKMIATVTGVYLGYKVMDHFGLFDKGGGDTDPASDYEGLTEDKELESLKTFTLWMLDGIADKQAYAINTGVVMRKLPKSNAEWVKQYNKDDYIGYIYSVQGEQVNNKEKIWLSITTVQNGSTIGWIPIEHVAIKEYNWLGIPYLKPALQVAIEHAEVQANKQY